MGTPSKQADEPPWDRDRGRERSGARTGQASPRVGGGWFAVAGLIGVSVVLLAWWLVERSWVSVVFAGDRLWLYALRGAMVSLLVVWAALMLLQRRRREAEASAARLRGILNSAPDSIVILDRDGRILLLNSQAEQVFGHDRASLLGEPVEVLIPDRLRDLVRARLDRAGARAGSGTGPDDDLEPSSGVELVGRRRDGAEVFVEARLAVVATAERTVVACILRDVGERKRADERLRKQTEILRLILDSMADAVIVADQDERFLIFNPAAERIFGIGSTGSTAEEWSKQYGLYRSDALTPFPADELPLRKSIRGEEVNDVEMFVRHHKTPQGIWVLINGRPLRDAEGGSRGGVIVCRDITERKLNEEALRDSAGELARSNGRLRRITADLEEVAQSRQKAYDELERAYRALKQAESQLIQAEKLSVLGQLIAGVAHEINNPLAFVASNVAILRRDARALHEVVQLHRQGMDTLASHHPELHDQIVDLCGRIDLDYTLDGLENLIGRSAEGLKRIQQIVRDLRDFTRLEEPDRVVADLNEGIRSTVNIIAGHAKKRGVTLELDLGPLPSLSCSPGKINQVVMNLLTNAIDACEWEGRVTIRTHEVGDVGAGSPNGDGGDAAGHGGVAIHVIDDGRGIAPEVRDRIFEAFFTTKPPGEGTGLGLSISAGIVQAHRGRIDVEAMPGRGTHFTVLLPRAAFDPPEGRGGTPTDASEIRPQEPTRGFL